jgi:hypothetical protein
LAERVEFALPGDFRIFFGCGEFSPEKSTCRPNGRKERNLKGLVGSNPPLSSSQSAVCVSLATLVQNRDREWFHRNLSDLHFHGFDGQLYAKGPYIEAINQQELDYYSHRGLGHRGVRVIPE